MNTKWGHISRRHPAKSQTFTEGGEDQETIRKLKTALRMVLENMGGHQHWDSFGTAGANCPICQRQQEAAAQAWEILRSC